MKIRKYQHIKTKKLLRREYKLKGKKKKKEIYIMWENILFRNKNKQILRI